jgi:hypothetical protein
MASHEHTFVVADVAIAYISSRRLLLNLADAGGGTFDHALCSRH